MSPDPHEWKNRDHRSTDKPQSLPRTPGMVPPGPWVVVTYHVLFVERGSRAFPKSLEGKRTQTGLRTVGPCDLGVCPHSGTFWPSRVPDWSHRLTWLCALRQATFSLLQAMEHVCARACVRGSSVSTPEPFTVPSPPFVSFLPTLPGANTEPVLSCYLVLELASLQRLQLIDYSWPSFCFWLASVEEG